MGQPSGAPRAEGSEGQAPAPQPGHLTRDEWFRRLTPAQKQYVKRFCGESEENGYDVLCGGTPLVAVFDGAPVEFAHPGPFAFAPGVTVTSRWPSARTPWLGRDLNGNGCIDDGSELLGSNTVLPGGALAQDGFDALAALDGNGDGVLDEGDPGFASLLLWRDDGDHLCVPAEVEPLSRTVASMSLHAVDVPRCDGLGNCERLRAPMTWRSADGALHAGEVVDVVLRHELADYFLARPINSSRSALASGSRLSTASTAASP